MGVFKRVSQVFQQKSNALLNKVEDPTQALDLSYEKMLENLQQVRKSIADVLTSQKRLEAQRAQLKAQYDKLQGQARQALQQGQEDVAKTALSRAGAIQPQISALNPQIDQLAQQEAALEETGRKLNSKIEAFRAQRDTMKAQYTAAKASSQALEGLTGLSDQMTDVNLMMDRAKDKIDQMQSRAAAVGELADSGVLDSPALGGQSDDIEMALAQGNPTSDVDLQLAALKAELASGSKPELAAAPAQPDQPPQPAALATPEPAEATTTLVVRILGEGRYRVPSTIRGALEGMDSALESALNNGDQSTFSMLVEQVASMVRGNGTELADADPAPDDLIVPPPDTTLEEAKKLFYSDEDTGTESKG